MKRQLRMMAGATGMACCVVLQSTQAGADDPTTADCLAASENSFTSRNEHRLRMERSQLLMCAAAGCPGDIRKECIRRVDEVNLAIPTIIFEAKDGAGNDLSAVKVTMDGEVLAEQLEGTALSVDPGQHRFVFETAGLLTLTKQFVISASQKDRLETITFDLPVSTSVGAVPSVAVSSGLGTQKILAIVAEGIGVVGLGVGSAFGAAALSKRNDAANTCPNLCADESGVHKWSDAKSAGNVSTVAFLVGGLALAGGAVLWFTAGGTAPSTGAPAAALGIGPASVQLKYAW